MFGKYVQLQPGTGGRIIKQMFRYMKGLEVNARVASKVFEWVNVFMASDSTLSVSKIAKFVSHFAIVQDIYMQY